MANTQKKLFVSMLSQRLNALRKEHQMTQLEVAARIGMTSSTFSHYESGKREPSLFTIVQLAKLYDVSVDYLLGLTDERDPASPPEGKLIELYYHHKRIFHCEI